MPFIGDITHSIPLTSLCVLMDEGVLLVRQNSRSLIRYACITSISLRQQTTHSRHHWLLTLDTRSEGQWSLCLNHIASGGLADWPNFVATLLSRLPPGAPVSYSLKQALVQGTCLPLLPESGQYAADNRRATPIENPSA